jgi:hypothetical protein
MHAHISAETWFSAMIKAAYGILSQLLGARFEFERTCIIECGEIVAGVVVTTTADGPTDEEMIH